MGGVEALVFILVGAGSGLVSPSCIPCSMALNETVSYDHTSMVNFSLVYAERVIKHTKLGFQDYGNDTFAFNYTLTTQDFDMQVLGLLGCMSFALQQLEQGANASFVYINMTNMAGTDYHGALAVCSDQKIFRFTDLSFDLVGGWVINQLSPRALQWACVIINLLAIAVAYT